MELPDRTSSEWSTDFVLLHVKQPPETHEKRFRVIQRSDLHLWTFSASTLVRSVELPNRTSSEWSNDSTLLDVKQPPETHEKHFRAMQRSDLYLWTFEPVPLSSRWNSPTGHRRSGIPIPRNSMSNSLLNLIKILLEQSNGRIYIYGPFEPVL